MVSDNRKFPRFDYEEVVQVQFIPPSSAQPLALKGKNISQDGLCLETQDFFLPNQIIQIDFYLARIKSFQTFATVMWSEQKTCGVRFLYPEKELENQLQQMFPSPP